VDRENLVVRGARRALDDGDDVEPRTAQRADRWLRVIWERSVA
jgi:hypothetical protein